jgi:thioesterase domain-containing protein/acyl carrier protein
MSAKDVRSPEAVGSTQDRDRFALSTAYAAPSTDGEKSLCAVWEQVLIIDGLGIDDDFFLLGGDSLAAVTLFTEVERIYGTKPPLATLVENPTVRKLAAYLDAATAAKNDAALQDRPQTAVQRPLVALQPAGDRLPLHLVHGNGGNILILAGLLPHLPPDQPLYGVTARGLAEGEALHTNFDALIEDYLAAIRRVQPAGPYSLGGYCIGGMIACEMARRLRATGEEVRPVIMIDPDYNRVLTPWLYWRFPDAPVTRLVRMFAGIAWHVRVAVLRALRWAPGGKMKAAKDRRRLYAMQDQLAKAFQQYGRQPYEGSVILLGSAERVERANRFKAGWRIIAPAIRMVVIAPTHYALFRSHISILGAAINAILEGRPVEDAVRVESRSS